MLKYIVLAIIVFLCYSFDLWLGIAATVLGIGYVVYMLLPNFMAAQGSKAFSEKDYEKALKFYKKAYETGRANMNIKNGYAVLLMRMGKFDDAETVLNEIILDRRLPREQKSAAKQYRTLLYFKQGKEEEALEDAEELFETYRNTTMYGLLGYIKLATNQPMDETLQFCRDAYEYNADDRDIVDNLVLALYKSGAYEEAEEYAADLREDHPEFLEAFYHSALIAQKLGDHGKAAEYAERIGSCNRTGLTTISEAEVDALKKELGM